MARDKQHVQLKGNRVVIKGYFCTVRLPDRSGWKKLYLRTWKICNVSSNIMLLGKVIFNLLITLTLFWKVSKIGKSNSTTEWNMWIWFSYIANIFFIPYPLVVSISGTFSNQFLKNVGWARVVVHHQQFKINFSQRHIAWYVADFAVNVSARSSMCLFKSFHFKITHVHFSFFIEANHLPPGA